MSLEYTYAFQNGQIISTYKFNYTNFRVDVQVPALNINHPAGRLLARPFHHDHYHVHDRKGAVIRPPSRSLSW